MTDKIALITGITGQDGYFLSKLLYDKGYEIHGIVRRRADNYLGNLEKLDFKDEIIIHHGDVTDRKFISEVIKSLQPDEVYHLAAQSFVPFSFENPYYTYEVNINGTLNIIESIKEYSPHTKMYNAATSEMFGEVKEIPQNENTPFHPRSPYAISKLASYWTVRNYREAYDLFLCNGILFNHESEIRGKEFVTRKISYNVAKIKLNLINSFEIGNLDARRDWGYAADYVEAMYMMLQHKYPDDYVISTGETHTVREFIEMAFKIVDIPIYWKGEGLNEVGIREDTGDIVVRVNKKYYRPLDVNVLLGDYTKAKKVLGWKPKVTFKELVKIMVLHDLKLLEG